VSESHNAYQRRYYTGRPLPRLAPERAGTPYVKRQVDAVLASLEIAPRASVLDVGCGLGKYTIALKDRGVSVEGLDLTPELIHRLADLRPDIPGHVADAADPPPDLIDRFDAAVGFFFLHHIEDLAAVLSGVRAMLRPGGRAAFLEPNPLFPGYYAQITLTPGMTWRGEQGMLSMRRGPIATAAAAAGLRLTDLRAFGAMPPAVANLGWGRRLERSFERLPGWDRVGAFLLIRLDSAG
jgi:SAM-dependent methyltransferase